MLNQDKDITSIEQFLMRLDTHKEDGQLVWFRGQIDIDWKVVPSIFRKGDHPIDRENSYFRKFKQSAGQYLDKDVHSSWDWFLLMQHYETPTRMLDWTESPLAALYFAVEEDFGVPENNDKDGVIYSFLPEKFNASVNRTSPIKNDIPLIGSDDYLDEYLFFGKNEVTFPSKPVAAIAQRNSPRIFAQQGVFVIYSDSPMPFEELADDCIWRYKIPSASKGTIRKELNLLGVNRLSLFPELGNLGKHIKGLE